MQKDETLQLINKQGITLVALVVTIIVLLILAGVTITILMGDNGIIKKAQEAADATNIVVEDELQGINELGDKMNSILGGAEAVEDEAVDITTVTTIDHKTLKAKDAHGNIIIVPEGFKIVESLEGEEISVQNGVVIEDSDGNQFVWIPVGVVIKNDGSKSNEIKLGRYIFDTSTPGTPTEKQLAYTDENSTNYLNTVTIESLGYEYQELSLSRNGVVSDGLDGENATAKNLAMFVQSVKDNGGYYIARYEASYGSGSNTSDYKPLSKISEGTPRASDSTALTEGMLWNYITQIDAAQVARNMYSINKDINGNNVGVESDLVNSYAWDTAIVYIQEMGHTNYANANRNTTGNINLMNTGATGDVVCNIYDMAANTQEWTTEHCVYQDSEYAYAYSCTSAGGHHRNSNGYYTSARNNGLTTSKSSFISFRIVLYIK